MRLDEGWLDCARRVPSPNYDQRPEGELPSLLVIHNISLPPGQFGSGCVQEFFCNTLDWTAHPFFEEIRGVEVSAHFLIQRGGEIFQFVNTNERAWHAGVSSFEGRSRCNDFSIGVELEGTDHTPYTEEQYSQLSLLTHCLIQAYPHICSHRIVGHSDIAPGRKTDPGPAFEWERYRNSLPN